jgi:hypothetical protein
MQVRAIGVAEQQVLRILVVDDEPGMVHMLRTGPSNESYLIAEANDGAGGRLPTEHLMWVSAGRHSRPSARTLVHLSSCRHSGSL